MRVRFPSLLVPRRRRLAAEPRENIGGWREVAPLTVTVNLRPITTVRPAVGGTIRPLVTRGLAVPARLTMAIGRPVDVRPAVDRPRRPVPTISRMERAPLPSVVTEEPEPAESWTDDDSIAELRAILNAARRQAAETDAPEADEPWQAPEPVDDDAVVVRSWPEPGAPPVRLPWEQDEPPAVAGIQEPPSRNRLAEPAPGRPRRLSLAESRRRGITVRPRHAEEPTVERRPVRVSPTPAAARPEKPGVPAEPEFVLPADEPAEAPADRQPEPEPAAPMRPPEPADHGPELDCARLADLPVEPADRDPKLGWAGSAT
ncbi:MAG TPA: hypothetical protein VJX10_00850, partial [Pseudonocardiaceae bacterium]|nr:hypothetical protein [Pseudonocardiaceae bacterium]